MQKTRLWALLGWFLPFLGNVHQVVVTKISSFFWWQKPVFRPNSARSMKKKVAITRPRGLVDHLPIGFRRMVVESGSFCWFFWVSSPTFRKLSFPPDRAEIVKLGRLQQLELSKNSQRRWKTVMETSALTFNRYRKKRRLKPKGPRTFLL